MNTAITQKRFLPMQTGIAPLTFGAPVNVLEIDYKAFQHRPGEKKAIKEAKILLGKTKHHKFETTMHGSF